MSATTGTTTRIGTAMEMGTRTMGRYALLVSADTYEDDTLARLRSPAVDAEALAGALADPGIGGFQIRRLHNRPSHQVAMEIEELFADRRRDDLLLLYFSCHGIKDDGGSLYFATTNTRHRRLRATTIPASFVSDLMEASASRRVVLLLDCCFSGAFARGLSPRAGGYVGLDRLAGRGTAIITASTAMEYAFESGGGPTLRLGNPRPSLFTGALVEGLATGGADLDADGLISVDELYDFVYDRVREQTSRQTPSRLFEIEGELVLARSTGGWAPPAGHRPVSTGWRAALSYLAGRPGELRFVPAPRAGDRYPTTSGSA
jgi:uncharacterized caspase-like protein